MMDSYVQRRLARLQRLQSGRFRSPIVLSALAWQRQIVDDVTLLVSRFAEVTKKKQSEQASNNHFRMEYRPSRGVRQRHIAADG
jgi:hypothetical protein